MHLIFIFFKNGEIKFLLIIFFIQSYFKQSWNLFDFVTVVGSIVDVLMVEFVVSRTFDKGEPLPEHPNGMVFELIDRVNKTLFTETPRRCFGGCKYVNSLSKTYVPYCQSFLISNLKLRQKIPNKNKTNSHKFYYLDVETFAEKSKLM